MTTRRRAAILVLIFAPLLIDGRPAHAAMFCNMDQVGGRAAIATQQASARASAAVFEALALTMRIFAQIELHFSGDQQALDRARALTDQAIRALNDATNRVRRIPVHSSVNEALQRTRRDFARVLALANVEPNDPTAQAVQTRLAEGAQQLLFLCADRLDELQSETTPMGQVYRSVGRGRAPQAEILLAAINQLNEVLKVGRLVTAVFAVAGR